MARFSRKRRSGFTLAELVVVLMMMMMIASMAIPRMSRGAVVANDTAVTGDLVVIRKALLCYAAEHRGTFPGPDAGSVVGQLTGFSNFSGATSPTRAGTFRYGPYLLRIPPCPIGHNPGSNGIAIDNVNSPPSDQPAAAAGWVYNANTGEFYPNATSEELKKRLPPHMTTALGS